MGVPSGWEVRLPERGRGQGHARATILPLAGDADAGTGHLSVPVAVGRRLSKRLSSCEHELSRSELLELVRDESSSCARERVVALVNRRDYSLHELADKLRADGYPSDVCEGATSWARQTGLADDARFAASFARSKALSGWGRARIERELARRGVLVEDELADDELFSEEAELERARRLASRRVRGDRSDFPRVVRLLCSKGYSYDLSMRVARELTSDGHVMD